MDSNWIPFLFMGFGILTIVMIAVLVHYLQKRHREAMRELAWRQGYDFSERDDALRDQLIAMGFPLFQPGHSKRLINVMRTRLERSEVYIFEYYYTTGGGKNSHTHGQTVLLFEKSEVNLPVFRLRPEGLTERLAQAFGKHDINFPDNPLFSKKYYLQGDNEDAVRVLFSGSLQDLLTAKTGLCLEGRGNVLLYYRHGKVLKPEQIPGFVDEGLEVWRLCQR